MPHIWDTYNLPAIAAHARRDWAAFNAVYPADRPFAGRRETYRSTLAHVWRLAKQSQHFRADGWLTDQDHLLKGVNIND